MNIQAKVALDKQKHPELYCAEPRCLWKVVKLNESKAVQVLDGLMAVYTPSRTFYEPKPDCPGGRCPRHQKVSQ